MTQALPKQTAWPLAATFAALLAWSTYAYATVRINADIVAEAIQVQRWLADPWWVWSYPGQRHGGVIEYPFIALAEWLAPGNVYGFTLVRVLYIPLVGLLLGLSIRWAFPRWSLWPFAIAAAVGPGVLHGFRMISDIYPFGWLLSASGVVLAYGIWARKITRAPKLIAIAAGALIGLGIYEHASAAVFSLPLVIAGGIHFGVRWRQHAWLGVGLLLGLIPMAIALFAQPDLAVVYSPTTIGLPNIAGVFGLSAEADAWRLALMPNGWGIQQADETLFGIPWELQIIVNAVAALAVLALVFPLLRLRSVKVTPTLTFVAILWASGTVVMLVMVSIVAPIWYYGTGIGFLVWITMSAIPNVLPRTWALVAIAVVIAVNAAVSARAVLLAEPTFLEGAQFKLGQARFNEQIAADVESAGVEYLYGDYWEVLPIAYASSGALIPITYDANRFPLPADTPDRIIVGLTSGYLATPKTLPRWTSAYLAEALVTDSCRERMDINVNMPDGVRAFECPREVLQPVKG